MRRASALVLIVLTTGVALAQPPPGPPSRVQTPAELADALLRAWNAHDAAALTALLDPRVTFADGDAPAQHGAAAVWREGWQPLFRAFPDATWRRDGPPVVGNGAVAFAWVRTGTFSGSSSDGTKPTGRKFEVRGASVLRIHAYRILYLGDFYDAHALRAQVGLPPPPSGARP